MKIQQTAALAAIAMAGAACAQSNVNIYVGGPLNIVRGETATAYEVGMRHSF